jgi:phosphoserine phosphatase RsbU/P
MFRNRSLALKLILFFSFSSILIFSAVFIYNYRYSREIILKNQEKDARNLALVAVNRIETMLNGVEKVPQNLADFLEKSSYGKEELLSLQKALVEHNQGIFGSAVAFEPYAFNKKFSCFVPYFFKKATKIEYTQLGQESYAYLEADWYQIPRELNTPQWSEPYYDEGGGNILMTTYSVPFFQEKGGNRRFRGIVTADVSLEWLQEIVSSIKILKTGYGFLISKNGTLVTHPSKELIMNATIFGLAEALGDRHLREIGRKMIKGESGSTPFQDPISSKECRLVYAPIPSTGWSLAVLFPLDELMADIQGLNRIMIIMAIVGLAVFSVAVIFISGRITGPLRAMAKATEEIAIGNLDIQLPAVRSRDEVGKMASAFVAMQKSLKTYIQKLTETTAAKERIESELNIAREIQMSILPKIFPPFPDRSEFDLFAVIEPAREVGGDFYDFFQIDPSHLCFIMADVSGKGVPAALFMAVTKTLIKATATVGITPAEILTRVNNELAEGNDAAMFVTVFCGILDTETGEVLYANAGHNPPLHIRKGGQVSYLENSGGLVLGVEEGIVYQVDRIQLEPGEMLFLYTDGVTEAMNDQEDLFSEERLQEELARCSQKAIQALIATLMQRINEFVGEAPQSDDITMMVLQYRGGKCSD